MSLNHIKLNTKIQQVVSSIVSWSCWDAHLGVNFNCNNLNYMYFS